MNILDKIVKLRLERGWSEYELAERSELTQSTISTWYRKNLTPTFNSLEHICKAFGISISQFFWEDEDTPVVLSSQQKRLLEYAMRLEPKQYEALIDFLKTL